MVCHKDWLLTCVSPHVPNYQCTEIIHLSAAKRIYNVILKEESRQPYHTKVLKWTHLNPGLSLERIGLRIIILLRNFLAIMPIFKAHLHYRSFLL